MTHALYNRQSLTSLKLSDLKAIAIKIGADVADKRIRASFIDAILAMQPAISTTQPTILNNAQESFAETSEAILDELEITFIDLSIGTDLVVPDGLDAYHAVYNGRVIAEVYNYQGGYVCRRGDGVVYNDPYSAIVNQYERYNPGAVLLALVTIERDKEIEAVRAALMPEYA